MYLVRSRGYLGVRDKVSECVGGGMMVEMGFVFGALLMGLYSIWVAGLHTIFKYSLLESAVLYAGAVRLLCLYLAMQ